VGVGDGGGEVGVGGAEVEVGVGGPRVGVAVGGGGVGVGGTGVLVGVGVRGTTTDVFVGGGTSIGVLVTVGVKVGCAVGSIVTTSVGVAAGRVISCRTSKNSTVKINPLRNTRTPKTSKYLSFIPHSFCVTIAPLSHSHGITRAWPTEMALGLSRPLAWIISSTVTPYVRAISLRVSPGCTT
jgi:hypothetical protein